MHALEISYHKWISNNTLRRNQHQFAVDLQCKGLQGC